MSAETLSFSPDGTGRRFGNRRRNDAQMLPAVEGLKGTTTSARSGAETPEK
jgi:hypothetical protein